MSDPTPNTSLSSNQPQPSPQDRAQKISDTIMSPYCPGMTLSACPSSDARSLRVEIQSRFEKGYTDEAVMNELKMRFGEKVLPAPQDSLLSGMAFLAPWCFIAISLLLLARYVKSIRERAMERKIHN